MAFYTQQVHFTVIECSENTFLAIIQHHSSGTGGGRLWPFIPLCPTMRISPPVLAEEKKTHADCFFPNIPPIQTQPPSYSHMLPHETAWGGACSRSERRTSAESNSDFTVNKFCRQPHLLFQCQSNQTGITVWRRYKKKKKKTRSSCAEMQSGVQTLKRIQTLYSTPFQQFRSTVSESCWFKGCIYIAVGCCAHAYIQTYTFGLQMSDRIED